MTNDVIIDSETRRADSTWNGIAMRKQIAGFAE